MPVIGGEMARETKLKAEAAAELWRRLEGGACLYLCSDAKRMAKDADAALHRIGAEQGAMPDGAAVEYVN